MFRHRTFATALACMALTTGPAWAAINAADFGVSEGNPNNRDAIQKALNAGKASGQEVVLPAGTLKLTGQVVLDGVKMRGQGNSTVWAPQDPGNQQLRLTGNRPSISNLRVAAKPIIRNGGDHARKLVTVWDAQNFNVSNVFLDGAAYGQPPGREGVSGMFIYRSKGGTISGNTIQWTNADSIHMTGGSSNITVTNNRIDQSQDDGIAAVQGADDILIQNNIVTNNRHGRGITAVGGDRVVIKDNQIDGNAENGAGIYIASEANYATGAPKDVLVEGNTIQGTGGPGKGHGQIMLWNGGGAPSNIRIQNNEVRNSETPQHAVVVSGSMGPGIVIEDNRLDGEITRRNGGNFSGSNSTGDGGMKTAISLPGVRQLPGVSGDGVSPPSGSGSNGGLGPGGTTGPGPGEYTPPTVPPSPRPDLTPRGSSAAGWRPNVTLPQIDQMRRRITSAIRPPNC